MDCSKRLRAHSESSGASLADASAGVMSSSSSFSGRTTAPPQSSAGAPLLSCLSHDGRLHASSTSTASHSFHRSSRSQRSSSCASDCTALPSPMSEEEDNLMRTSPAHQPCAIGSFAQHPAPPPAPKQGEGEGDVERWLVAEARFTPTSVFATQASSGRFTTGTREMLVEWTSDVVANYGLQPETFLLAVNYLDRYLSVVAVCKPQLQLLGAACLWMASKYEDVHAPSAQQMSDMTDNTYTVREIVRMEARVAEVLRWNLAVPCSSLRFLRAFAERAQVTSRAVLALSECLVQLAALDGATFAHAPASRVAACALSVALAACSSTAGIPLVVKAAQWRDNDELAYMSKELYARFTRSLAPGAKPSSIVLQYIAAQRVMLAQSAPFAPPQTMSCAAQSAAVASGNVRLPPPPPPPPAQTAYCHHAFVQPQQHPGTYQQQQHVQRHGPLLDATNMARQQPSMAMAHGAAMRHGVSGFTSTAFAVVGR